MTALYEDDRLCELYFDDHKCSLGNIYIGKVKNIVKNINAAFVDIGDGQLCYYPLAENAHHLFANEKNNSKLVSGDEIVVQLVKEAIKTKDPMVSSNLNFTGRYIVLTVGKPGIGISNKIREQKTRDELREVMTAYACDDYGFIVRTNAAAASKEELSAEIEELIREYQTLMDTYRFKTCFSVLKKSETDHIRLCKNLRREHTLKITTDLVEVYEELNTWQTKEPSDSITLSFYEDNAYPLLKLKGIESAIEKALRKQVWLKSGASIVIEQTEALVAIDVNTGKYVGKKPTEETFFKINMEAAVEIGRQLRLRNLSGIIIVDFINMKKKAYKKELMSAMTQILNKDFIKTALVDMTALDLMEITRKKERKSLAQYMEKEMIK